MCHLSHCCPCLQLCCCVYGEALLLVFFTTVVITSCKAAESKSQKECARRWLFWSFFCSFLVVGGYFNLLIHFINNHRWRFSGICHACSVNDLQLDLPSMHCCPYYAWCTLYCPSLNWYQQLMLMLLIFVSEKLHKTNLTTPSCNKWTHVVQGKHSCWPSRSQSHQHCLCLWHVLYLLEPTESCERTGLLVCSQLQPLCF